MVKYSYLQLAAIGAVFVETTNAQTCQRYCLSVAECEDAAGRAGGNFVGSSTTQGPNLPTAGCFSRGTGFWFGNFGSYAQKNIG